MPRLVALLTDPNGFVADDGERVAAAGKRYEDATGGGWRRNVLIDTTDGRSIDDWAADLWAVNGDQERDAMLIASEAEVEAAVLVGSQAGRTILPDGVREHRGRRVAGALRGPVRGMIDGVADGLVVAHQEGPESSPTPKSPSTAKPTPSTVKVPDFLGRTKDEATLLAARRGLEVSFTNRRTSEAPRGTVIEQGRRPASSSRWARPWRSSWPPRPRPSRSRTSPGDREADAVSALIDAGLEPGTKTTRTSDSIAKGRIMRTDPKAGTQVDPSTVDYVVSRGPSAQPTEPPQPTPTPSQVEVPRLRGLTVDEATAALEDINLRLGQVAPPRAPSSRRAKVVRTDPVSGTIVKPRAKIDLLVSTGPAVAEATPQPQQTPRPTPRPTPKPTLKAHAQADAQAHREAGAVRGSVGRSGGRPPRAHPGRGRPARERRGRGRRLVLGRADRRTRRLRHLGRSQSRQAARRQGPLHGRAPRRGARGRLG
ncbi:MAG: PASTA domain-containing protein [Tetrasphaera sp.]